MTIRPRRSVLYMPGSNARALEKARTLAADCLILDLEDAVAPDVKDLAREQVCAAVQAGGFGQREVIIRINGLSTAWGRDDLAAASAAKPDAILLPKVSRPEDLHSAEVAMRGEDATISIWAMVETSLAVLNIGAIAAAGRRLSCLVMGTNDLIKEVRGQHMPNRTNLSAALGLSILAARAHGLSVIDGVYNDLSDSVGFATACQQGRSFGFDGKTLNDPGQIEACNTIFAPSADEIASAKRILAAFEEPENRDKGAIKLDGRMVELLHAEMARHTVALADAIAGRAT